MNTYNIPFQYKKENHPKLSQICSYGIFYKGLKNDFEAAVENEPSVFEPRKFYCMYECTLYHHEVNLLRFYENLCFSTTAAET